MGKQPQDDGVSDPSDSELAVKRAVRKMLSAASDLCKAADLASEGDCVDGYINTAIRLRDIASAMSPTKPEWPANVIPFIPRKAWED